MTDLKTMMANMSLADIENEIKTQLQTIERHPDLMKRATLLSILLKETMEHLEKIKPEQFVEPFETRLVELQKKVKRVDTGIKKNFELLEKMKPLPDLLQQMEQEITPMLKDCDEKVKEIKDAISKLPVEEIAKLKKDKK